MDRFSRNRVRGYVQGFWTLLTNGHLPGFFKNRIYGGKLKSLCLPGLNCYSCPGALGACPVGALQTELAARNVRFPLYVLGFLLLVGTVLGRFVCGFLCPFGWIQELLHRIPTKKIGTFRGDKPLRYLKYLVLAVLVVLLPAQLLNPAGNGSPWFCKLLCPAGTLEGGVGLVLFNAQLRALIGNLYFWKILVLLAVLVASVSLYRPFCKYLCPLGAIYGFFNRISLYRLRVDAAACTHCGVCARACRMQVDPAQTPGSAECIRCGDCVKNCPTGAIRCGFGGAAAGKDAPPAER